MTRSDRREYSRAYARQYRLDHPDYASHHRAENRSTYVDYARKDSANKRAKLYGAPGVLTLADVRDALAVRVCVYCGSEVKIGIDHVIPLHAGGPNTRGNIVACCHPCNQSKRRADRPGRWSQLYDQCQGCGSSERRHKGHGLCVTCYRVGRYRNDTSVQPSRSYQDRRGS